MVNSDKIFHVYNNSDLQYGSKAKIEISISPSWINQNLAAEKVQKYFQIKNLEEYIDNCKKKERGVYNKALEAIQNWAEYAKETRLANMALEYKNFPKVRHTNNQWIKNNCNSTEISNAVYSMIYYIHSDEKYNKNTEKQEIDSYHVSWYVYIGRSINNIKIAGQDNKKFQDKERTLKYIEGRKKAYQNLFQEEYPPIPPKYKNLFCVNGILLPGYKVAE